jgi:hypothetical protein
LGNFFRKNKNRENMREPMENEKVRGNRKKYE